MVYSYVKSIEGVVTVDSDVGQGTEFRIFIPRSLEEIKKDQVSSEMNLRGNQQHVMIVEDDTLLRKMVARMLSDLDYVVTPAATGDEAITLLGADNKFDLVISDLVMPGETSGIDLANQIHAHHKDTRIVLTTGYFSNIDALDSAAAKSDAFLEKPYDMRKLASTVQKTLVSPRKQ
jgi:two-component system cell cycle sensor histidine kinase/response regulator CckA